MSTANTPQTPAKQGMVEHGLGGWTTELGAVQECRPQVSREEVGSHLLPQEDLVTQQVLLLKVGMFKP